MSKKAILSALLVSSALLGATAANAATSDIKAESKKVTVSTEKAKLYKDSKLKESTTPKNGTVYQVDGYRNINDKHVYRVYQTDKNGKKAYRGYIDSKDTKDLKAEKAKGQFVLNGKTNVWKNFYWTAKNTDNAERVVFAKYEYTLGNGQKYYSVYSKDAAGKEVWQGYTTKSNLKEVTSTKESKYVALKKDTKSFANLYFQQTKGNFDVKSGVNFKVTRYYTIDGKKYYSTERAGKTWTGYVDSSVVEDLKAEKVAAADSYVKVAKDWNTYSDHFYTKKAKLADYKGKNLTAKYVYTYGNGKKYASLYDGDTWVGYANVQALASNTDEETRKAIDAANDAIKKAEDILSKAQASKESKEAAQKVIDAAKETVKKGNLEDIKKVPAQIAEAIKGLKPGATTIDIQRVEEAIKSGEEAIKSVESQGIGSQDKERVQAVKDAIENAKKVIADMKKGDASTEDADKAIQAIEDAINELGAPATTISLEQLREAIHEAERLYRATENAAVTGRDELGKEIKAAKDLLASAKDGKVTNKQVTDEIKKLEDAMNNVKFDKKDLLDEVAAVQKLASNVYMTKDGEEKFVKAMTAIMNLDANSDNYGKFLEAKSVLADAKAGLEKQPNKADGEALNKAMNRVKELAKLPNQGKDLYGTPALKEAYNKANQLMTEMKKVTDKENKATVKISKAEVEKATQDLNLAFDNLGLNEDALNTFIKAAKDLESKDDKFTNNVEFKKAVVDLEVAAKDTHFENYGKIVDAARKVYDMMIQDLQTVYNGVLPWNNNQAEVNPEVNVISPKLGVKAIKEDTAATPGTTLSQKEFVSDIVSKAGHVADYYTKDSYDKFATALTVAQTILADAKTKDKVSSSASVSAQAGVQVNNAMKELVDAQEGLRFNKDKLIEFSNNGHAAVQKWQIEAKKAVSQKQKSGATATVSTVEQVEANGKAANQGFWALGYQQNGKWMGHKDESGKTFLEGLTDEQLKPNKENAEKLAQMMYNAENDYYTYAYTVAPQLKK